MKFKFSGVLSAFLIGFLLVSGAQAGTVRDGSDLAPTGKGWGVEQSNSPSAAEQGNGISNSPFAVVTGNHIKYHGGPIMPGTVNVYFIWYGNWTNGPKKSDRPITVQLLESLFGTGGIGGSGYERINTTYGDNASNVTGDISLAGEYFDSGSLGKKLTDAKVQTIVSNAISNNNLPNEANGIYFVLTSSDISERSGFCSRYCGWHTNASLAGTDIKYAFVGNSDRCPFSCEMQTVSPNGDSGADGMASIMAHEAEEALTDPDLNAWYDSTGQESADKCGWMFGPTKLTPSRARYNQIFDNGSKWLIQMNWENTRRGGCDQTLGGFFYSQ